MIEDLSRQIQEILSAGEPMEVMHLKLKLEVSAGKLFLALGWLLHEGSIEMAPSEYGYKVRLIASRTFEAAGR